MNIRLGVRVKMSRRWQDEEVSFCMPRRHELTEEEWELIEELFPENGHHRGGQWKDNRMMLNAIFWWLRTGAPWRDLPERYGPWKTVYDRFNRWRKDGTWANILDALLLRLDDAGLIDRDLWCVDASNIRASRAAAGAKKKSARATAVGRA